MAPARREKRAGHAAHPRRLPAGAGNGKGLRGGAEGQALPRPGAGRPAGPPRRRATTRLLRGCRPARRAGGPGRAGGRGEKRRGGERAGQRSPARPSPARLASLLPSLPPRHGAGGGDGRERLGEVGTGGAGGSALPEPLRAGGGRCVGSRPPARRPGACNRLFVLPRRTTVGSRLAAKVTAATGSALGSGRSPPYRPRPRPPRPRSRRAGVPAGVSRRRSAARPAGVRRVRPSVPPAPSAGGAGCRPPAPGSRRRL